MWCIIMMRHEVQGTAAPMRSEERIQDLCAQAVAEQDPKKLASILAELKAALREHQLTTENLLYLHRKLFTDVA